MKIFSPFVIIITPVIKLAISEGGWCTSTRLHTICKIRNHLQQREPFR